MAPELSIVIPAFDEARRIGGTLEKIFAWLTEQSIEAEILVVDDGCRDDTARIATEIGKDRALEVLSYGQNRGKGYAVRYGMLRARGDRILFSDADLSTPIAELLKLRAALDNGYDVAIGSRAVEGSNVVVSQSGLRKYGGKVFNLAVRLILPLPFRDTQCGFKLFEREAAREIFSACRLDGFSFDVEAMHLALRLGCKVAEVPVEWHNSPESKVNFARDAARMLRDVMRIRYWDSTGQYQLSPSTRSG